MVATTLPAATKPPTEPRRPSVERFDIGPVLGRGGMGEVRLAKDLRVDRDVAIKLLRDNPAPDVVARFMREARVQARLDHPAIVPVYDVGVDDDGVPYFAMKRLTGVTLQQVLEGGAKWPRRQLLTRFVEVCLAIELAHTKGVVHRDLKPANIMLGDFGEVYVLDWGIASIGDEACPAIGRGDATTETATGALLGTVGYMAPEQIQGTVEPRTDVFALGLVLYEILGGRSALPRSADAYDLALAAPCYRPSRVASDIPPELDEVCARATANRAADRYPSARALADAVTAYLDGDRDLERRRELAEDHVATAAEALASAEHAIAMREVGCALALEPTNAHALEMARRIMTERPREIPAKVRAKREADRRHAGALHLSIAVRTYACFLAFVPLALFTQLHSRLGAAVITVGLAGGVLGARYVRRHPHLLERWVWVGLGLNTMLISVTGILVGPFQVVPVLAVASLALLLTNPGTTRYGLMTAAHMVMIVIPIALEAAGLTIATYEIDGGTMTIGLGVELAPPVMLAFIVGTVWILQLIISLITVRQRRAQEAAREELYLHNWRLEQLLPQRLSLPPA